MGNEIQAQPKQEAQVARGAERISPQRVFMPACDIVETPNDLVIVADMPGVDDKSLDVTLEKNVLTIRGEVEPDAPAHHTLAYAEYEVGNYERVFTLSDEIDRENIKATVHNGQLRLVLPKAGPARTRKITVKAE